MINNGVAGVGGAGGTGGGNGGRRGSVNNGRGSPALASSDSDLSEEESDPPTGKPIGRIQAAGVPGAGAPDAAGGSQSSSPRGQRRGLFGKRQDKTGQGRGSGSHKFPSGAKVGKPRKPTRYPLPTDLQAGLVDLQARIDSVYTPGRLIFVTLDEQNGDTRLHFQGPGQVGNNGFIQINNQDQVTARSALGSFTFVVGGQAQIQELQAAIEAYQTRNLQELSQTAFQDMLYDMRLRYYANVPPRQGDTAYLVQTRVRHDGETVVTGVESQGLRVHHASYANDVLDMDAIIEQASNPSVPTTPPARRPPPSPRTERMGPGISQPFNMRHVMGEGIREMVARNLHESDMRHAAQSIKQRVFQASNLAFISTNNANGDTRMHFRDANGFFGGYIELNAYGVVTAQSGVDSTTFLSAGRYQSVANLQQAMDFGGSGPLALRDFFDLVQATGGLVMHYSSNPAAGDTIYQVHTHTGSNSETMVTGVDRSDWTVHDVFVNSRGEVALNRCMPKCAAKVMAVEDIIEWGNRSRLAISEGLGAGRPARKSGGATAGPVTSIESPLPDKHKSTSSDARPSVSVPGAFRHVRHIGFNEGRLMLQKSQILRPVGQKEGKKSSGESPRLVPFEGPAPAQAPAPAIPAPAQAPSSAPAPAIPAPAQAPAPVPAPAQAIPGAGAYIVRPRADRPQFPTRQGRGGATTMATKARERGATTMATKARGCSTSSSSSATRAKRTDE